MASSVVPQSLTFLMTSPLRTALTPIDQRLTDLGIQPGMTVLELGCGNGFLLPALAERVGKTGHVYGLDLHPGLLEQARARVPESAPVTLLVADAANPPLPDASLDAVVIHFAFHSFTDRSGVVREARRMLKTGGTVGLWEPALLVEPWRMSGWEGLFWGQGFALERRLQSMTGQGRLFKAVDTPAGSRLRPR